VLVPDLPGFGGSELLDGPASLDDVASAVVDALDERDVQRCVVGGVSLGGYAAMALVRRHPERCAGLFLCDTKATADAPAARENRERLAGLVEADPASTGRILETAVLPGLLGDTTRETRPLVVEQVRGWLHEAPAATVAWYQRAMAERPDSLEVLAQASLPTVVVWGEEDALSPRAEQDAMVDAIADCLLVSVPGAGHLANVEDPGAVSIALERFLNVVRGPRTA
jgi:pimeloyl-ACP methyl ester carboxylesterase